MKEEIVNRVANSSLKVIDLEDLYLNGKRTLLNITAFLDEGVLLREQSFRLRLSETDWSLYENHFVAVYCPDDVLIPQWATLLVIAYLQPVAGAVVVGTLNDLENHLFGQQLYSFDTTPYKNGIVMIKGCANKPVPLHAMGALAAKLVPVVKKLSYGEACSSVPLYKKP